MIKIVNYGGEIDEFVWKFPSNELGTWTQLIVNETQEALFLKDGKICDVFQAGKYTLSSNNIPILSNLINLPFGGESPFKAEVWFVNKRTNLDIKWGTPSPIQLQDAKYNIFIPVRAFGQFGMKIEDGVKFYVKFVGTKNSFSKSEINTFFKGIYLTKVKDLISSYLIKKKISILEINSYINELSEHVASMIEPIFEEYGIRLVNFNINDINVSENDEGVIRLKNALAKRAEMDIVGYSYAQERSFDTMEGAAKNTASGGMANNLMGAGLGMAMGVGLGNNMQETMASNLQTDNKIKKVECKNCGASIGEDTLFCPECGAIQKKKCGSCGAIQEKSDSKFCSSCGESLVKKCTKCSSPVDDGAKFCNSCGEKL